jgi:hypothetical protein
VTLVTDQNGTANALMKTGESAVSQAALVRVTDLVTGNRVDQTFTIVQKINGEAVLSVVPGSYSNSGFFVGECGGTSGDFLIYGGRPPYTARSSLFDVRLSVNGLFVDPAIVTFSGGRFTASTGSSACGSAGYKSSIVVTDADGRSVTVTYEEKPGTTALPTPATLRVSPSAVSFDNCAAQRTVTFSIIGGTAPFVTRVNRPADATVAADNRTVTLNAGVTGILRIEVVDANSNLVSTTITCPGVTPAGG